MNNPFPTSGYYGAQYFCDRTEETKTLIRNIRNGQSTTLISLRRMGKSGLIWHLKQKLGKEYIFIYADIFATANKAEMLQVLVLALLKAVNQETSIGKKVWEFIKQLRPVISYDPLTNSPQMSFDVKESVAESNIHGLIQFVEQLKLPVVIAIDEFQQITEYPEKNMDAWFRSIYQHLKNTRFVFSGSKQHLMMDLFSNPQKPFFRSTAILFLEKIPQKEYLEFILTHFKNSKRKINEETALEILEWCKVYTYYVQLLCNRIFSSGEKKITSEIWQREAYRILKEQEALFINFRELLTRPQWDLLIAIALEEKVYMPTSSDFISKYKLGNPSTVLRSLDALLEKEMIYSILEEQGKYYSVYDLLLVRWVQHIMGLKYRV